MAARKILQETKTTQTRAVAKRTNRGRKPEAIKEIIPPTVKKYRTRKDYIGDGWEQTLAKATPTRSSKPKKLEVTDTVKKVKGGEVETKINPRRVASIRIVPNTKDAIGDIEVENARPLPAEFAYNLMELCSKYMFVLKNAYGSEGDGITEIDIHIKVKPSPFGAAVC